MPPHIAIYTADTNVLAPPIAIAGLSGGEESAVYTLDLWNDKNADYLDTETAQDIVLKILASSSGAPYVDTGVPLLDQRWSWIRVLGKLSAAGLSTDGASGYQPAGTNSELSLPDLDPQTGVRIEFKVVAPAGAMAGAIRIKLQPNDGAGSSPLAKFVGLASGSGVVPGDRVPGLRALLRGFVVTADDTDEITVGRGLLTHDGTEAAHLSETIAFSLADGDGVNLGPAEAYNVTLSATASAGTTVTKGPKAEAVDYPAVPEDEILVARFTVESTDGVTVSVSPSSVDQDFGYHEFSVYTWAGLAVIVGPGDGLTDSGFRQPSSHFTVVPVDATSTSRIWRLGDGAKAATLTDVPPEPGADLLALVTTDASNVTSIVDARRFIHRALVMDHIELTYRGIMTAVTPSNTLALAYAHDDFEIEEVELNLSAVDAGWTGGAFKANVLVLAPGAPAPWPSGAPGGVTIFTGFATDDARPSIAFDATDLRAVSRDHEVRRIVKGSRILLAFAETVAGPGAEPEQEVRVTLHVRRYR